MTFAWQSQPIAALAHHNLGKMLDRAKNRGELKPYLRNLNVRWFDFDLSDLLQMRFETSEAERYTVRKGDLVICEGGYPGRAAVWDFDEPVYFQKALHRVRFHDPRLARWCLYFLLYQDVTGQLRAHFNGAGIQHFTGEALAKFEIPVPPVEEASRLVTLLDASFDGISTAKDNAEKILLNARELEDTFLAALFSPTLNWTAGPLSAFVESVSTGPFGSMLHKSDYVADGVPLVNPINIVDGSIVPTDEKQVDAVTAERLRSYLLRSGDIVVGRRGEIGRCAVVADAQEGWLCGTGCFFIRPSSRVEPSFIAHLIRSPQYRARLKALSTGTTMQNLSNSALSNIQVALPDLAEQRRLLAAIDAMSAQTDQLLEVYARKLAALDELKRSLLHQAFTGGLS